VVVMARFEYSGVGDGGDDTESVVRFVYSGVGKDDGGCVEVVVVTVRKTKNKERDIDISRCLS